MSARADGTAVCNGCGADVGFGTVDRAAVASYLTAAGRIETVHLCVERCAGRVLAGLRYHPSTDDGSLPPATVAGSNG